MNEKTKKLKYLQACRIMDMYNEMFNPCNICKLSGSLYKCNGLFSKEEGLCCSECKHLGQNGCTTASLGCKLSFCYCGYSPSMAGIFKGDSIANKRFLLLKKIILDYLKKYDIPIEFKRMSYDETVQAKKKVKIIHHF